MSETREDDLRRISELAADNERLRAELEAANLCTVSTVPGQTWLEALEMVQARIDAALAIEPFERWQDVDELVVSHEDMVKALKGSGGEG